MQLNELLKLTRQYFWDLNFTEVETNYLQEELPLESNLYAFQTGDYFLPMSPEFALKDYLAREQKNCFSIAHCFRRLEATGPHHHPEFLMLEYYLVNQNLSDLQKSLEKYISKFLKIKFENFRLPAKLPANEPDFNQFFLNEIEPKLPRDRAVFVTGYPAFLSPLASATKESPDNYFSQKLDKRVPAAGGVSERAFNTPVLTASGEMPPRKGFERSATSQRFELYVNGIEIANGCEENRNPELIKSSFETEKKYRQKNNLPLHPYSQNFLNNSARLPRCCGVGIGLDRLLMVINGHSSL